MYAEENDFIQELGLIPPDQDYTFHNIHLVFRNPDPGIHNNMLLLGKNNDHRV